MDVVKLLQILFASEFVFFPCLSSAMTKCKFYDMSPVGTFDIQTFKSPYKERKKSM